MSKSNGGLRDPEAAAELGVSERTIRTWRKSCWLLPDRRGLNSRADINAIKKKLAGQSVGAAAVERLRETRRRNMRAAQRRSVERRRPAEGIVTVRGATILAGVGSDAVRNAYKRRELIACSKKPLRFAAKAVKEWAEGLELQPGDVRIIDLPSRIPSPAGLKSSSKLIRIRRVIRVHGIEAYYRRAGGRRVRCVRIERVPEIAAKTPWAPPTPETPAIAAVARSTSKKGRGRPSNPKNIARDARIRELCKQQRLKGKWADLAKVANADPEIIALQLPKPVTWDRARDAVIPPAKRLKRG